ncbi:AraC family transcriptional regulator [Pontibacter anaerobius]|uniref:AraC family transcriptional regulator n=1 Tax=Pontibacter anaerobius TaxID=2993940 RepID=A0ABT3RD98_9BACT|nr:AraC family transcriptional regulator [Pontibacter anaerobius]MCX2739515.1 AraC family transcriptional regulator [Pontibacter anaerobius]
MKPQLLKVATSPTNSFSVRQNMIPYMNNRWHFHPEVELILFHKGSGMQFVGDSIMRFRPNDIVLVGSNLPHYWRFDDIFLNDTDESVAYTTTIHFMENFWGDRFLHLPENKQIKQVLHRAKRGILISGKAAKKVTKLMTKAHMLAGAHRVISLMKCLTAIAEEEEVTQLSSIGYQADLSDVENERINAIYEHTLTHFKRKIPLEEIAAIANMTPNSFCRYFKEKTGKTFSQFMTEIRIGYACKLIVDNKMSIKQLCFESGFNNFSCFHKSFKQIMGKTPQNYQKQYESGALSTKAE